MSVNLPMSIDGKDRLFKYLSLFFFIFLYNPQPMHALPYGAQLDATVLIYHRFGEDRYPTTNISVEQFREQMAYLAAENYRVIPLAELIASLNSSRTLPEKSVIITIDDGYESVYRNAWPILKSRGYPFTVFINSKNIGSEISNYMNWDEIIDLHENGVDIQSHSYGHARLADRPQGMTESGYLTWIRADLNKNAKIISEKLGIKPRFFAIPYGEYNQQVIAVARQLGYEAILTQDPGSVSRATDPHMIPREAILGSEWATMPHFMKILRRVDLPITDMQPPYGDVEESPGYYSARLINPDRYESDSFGIYISELGWLATQLQGDKLIASSNVKLSRKLNRVMIKAREKGSGKTAVRSWLLVRSAKD